PASLREGRLRRLAARAALALDPSKPIECRLSDDVRSAAMGSRLTLDRAPYDRERDPQTLSRAFREPGPQGPTQRTAGAEGRPEHSLHLGRNAAASALLPGLERSSLAPAREQPEMLAHRRHRRGGEDR